MQNKAAGTSIRHLECRQNGTVFTNTPAPLAIPPCAGPYNRDEVLSKPLQRSSGWRRNAPCPACSKRNIFMKITINNYRFSQTASIILQICSTHCGQLFGQSADVTPEDASGGTDTAASGRFTSFESFDAQIAFHSDAPVFIELHGAKGTGLQALPATDTQLLLDQDNSLMIVRDCV